MATKATLGTKPAPERVAPPKPRLQALAPQTPLDSDDFSEMEVEGGQDQPRTGGEKEEQLMRTPSTPTSQMVEGATTPSALVKLLTPRTPVVRLLRYVAVQSPLSSDASGWETDMEPETVSEMETVSERETDEGEEITILMPPPKSPGPKRPTLRPRRVYARGADEWTKL